MPRGYDRPLYIQPFDHRGSFQTKMFGWQSPLSNAQTAEIAAAKRVIYDGFLAALAGGVPKEKAGILVDEQFGAAILRDAASNNVVTACPAEKSGQEEFDFEYGEDFARHIELFELTFCKVLVRYNPQGDRALNQRQAARLKRLSDYLADKNRSRFMFELLVPPEKTQLDKLKGDKKIYDREVRPRLMVEAIRELQNAGVEPDLWKIEGLDRRDDCEQIVTTARAIGSVALFSAAVRTIKKCESGLRWRRLCRASSALRLAARPSGIRWSPGGAKKRPASRLSPKLRAAIASSQICSNGQT
jgi:myo-inositol catabolism protein IolC